MARAMSAAGLRPPERLFLRYPHELSGGQRQRVLIAGALALEPTVLIADEPVSSLDASIRGEILGLLLRLRDELGLTVVVVTHDLGLAWNIADRIAVMYLGRVVESGRTEDVLESPRHPYTRALLSVVPEIGRLEPVVLTGEIPDPTRIPAGCRFHPRCPSLLDGSAAEAGVAEACRETPLAILPAAADSSGGRQVACHLDAALRGKVRPTPGHVTIGSPNVVGMDEVFRRWPTRPGASLLDELFREDGQTLGALEERFAMTRFGVMKHLQRARGGRSRRDPSVGAGRSSTSSTPSRSGSSTTGG